MLQVLYLRQPQQTPKTLDSQNSKTRIKRTRFRRVTLPAAGGSRSLSICAGEITLGPEFICKERHFWAARFNLQGHLTRILSRAKVLSNPLLGLQSSGTHQLA